MIEFGTEKGFYFNTFTVRVGRALLEIMNIPADRWEKPWANEWAAGAFGIQLRLFWRPS